MLLELCWIFPFKEAAEKLEPCTYAISELSVCFIRNSLFLQKQVYVLLANSGKQQWPAAMETTWCPSNKHIHLPGLPCGVLSTQVKNMSGSLSAAE